MSVLDLCPHFNWVILWLSCESPLQYSGCKTLISNMICKYVLPFCGLSAHFLDSVLGCTEVFDFAEVQFISLESFYFLFCFLCFWCHV